MLIQSQSPSLRHLTTAHLAQTMALMELTGEELGQMVEAALARNPALELASEPRCPGCQRILPRRGPCPTCSAPTHQPLDEPIVFVSPRQDFLPRGRALEEGDTPEEWTAAVEPLPTFVMRQIATDLAPEDRPIAAHILTGLDEAGLLSVPLQEIARYHHTTLTRVQKVQRLIQSADPAGVGSSSSRQALVVQLEILAETRPVPPLADRAIEEGLELLSRRAYSELARLLNISVAQAGQIATFISENLNPYPAHAHWGDIHQGPGETMIYQAPDILISHAQECAGDGQLVVEIVSPYAGALRVNKLFRQAISEAPPEKAEKWQADLDDAVLLVKCIQQRNNTLVRLMQRLVGLQRSYILHGDAHLAPITRAQMAEELDLHESTISRAVASKTVQLPNKRVVPLSKWFDRSLNVRTALLQIIAQETQPLSDTQIADLLAEQGYDVARRTVAKYRSMEKILPARMRRPHLGAPG